MVNSIWTTETLGPVYFNWEPEYQDFAEKTQMLDVVHAHT